MTRRNSLIAIIACIALVAVAWFVTSGDARLVVEKMMTALAMPYGMAWLVTSVMLLLSIYRKDRWLVVGLLTVWCLLYFFGNGYVARVLMRQIEAPYVAEILETKDGRRKTVGPFDAVIVLGGGTALRPDGSAQVAKGGDRVVTAARLYHAGGAKKIICTGSLISGIDRYGMGQGEIAEQILLSLDVDPADIERVGGRTTAEEMKILADRFEDDSRVGLITSAWHLPRAERLANAEGFYPRPVASNFGSPPDMRPAVGDLFPSAQAAEAISRVVKEWLAGAVGR